MVNAECLREQAVIRFNDITVAVPRKFCAEAVTGLRGAAVAETVAQHDIVRGDIERLTGSEEFARKLRLEELRSVSGRTVHDQYGVRHAPLDIATRSAEGRVVNVNFRQALA